MAAYIGVGVKLVQAVPMTRADWNDINCRNIGCGGDPYDKGYYVAYPDGYKSWCPKAQFEAAYLELESRTRITPCIVARSTRDVKAVTVGSKATHIRLDTATGFHLHEISACVPASTVDQKQ